jgi:O-antigen ligase
VQRLNSTDLSFIFRLKHWVNLFDIMARGSISDLLFGHGVDSSILLSEHHLLAHNDYLKYFFELGLLGGVAFLSLITLILYRCGRCWNTVPLLTIAIYFVCENLVNNYLAMMIFYFCAGAFIARRKE